MVLKIAQEEWLRAALSLISLWDLHRALGSWPCVGFTWHARIRVTCVLVTSFTCSPLKSDFLREEHTREYVCGLLFGSALHFMALSLLSSSVLSFRILVPL